MLHNKCKYKKKKKVSFWLNLSLCFIYTLYIFSIFNSHAKDSIAVYWASLPIFRQKPLGYGGRKLEGFKDTGIKQRVFGEMAVTRIIATSQEKGTFLIIVHVTIIIENPSEQMMELAFLWEFHSLKVLNWLSKLPSVSIKRVDFT